MASLFPNPTSQISSRRWYWLVYCHSNKLIYDCVTLPLFSFAVFHLNLNIGEKKITFHCTDISFDIIYISLLYLKHSLGHDNMSSSVVLLTKKSQAYKWINFRLIWSIAFPQRFENSGISFFSQQSPMQRFPVAHLEYYFYLAETWNLEAFGTGSEYHLLFILFAYAIDCWCSLTSTTI